MAVRDQVVFSLSLPLSLFEREPPIQSDTPTFGNSLRGSSSSKSGRLSIKPIHPPVSQPASLPACQHYCSNAPSGQQLD